MTDYAIEFRLLISQKVKTAYKTLTFQGVTWRKLTTTGLLILILFNHYLSRGSLIGSSGFGIVPI